MMNLAMELQEMRGYTVEEVAELLSYQNDNEEIESQLMEYAIQRDLMNRTRNPASRRLLQSNHTTDHNNQSNNNQKDSAYPTITMIHTSNANWPPSRKKEEARALENLRKRIEQSKFYKIDPSPCLPSTSSMLSIGENLDNRPKLFQKIFSDKLMSVAHDANDLETDWRDSEFITECLCWHNVYRQRHNSSPLTMSPKLCQYAQTWANHLAHTNTFYYRNDRNVGQNLYFRPGGGITEDINGQDVAFYWYSAVKQYNFFKEPDVLHANGNAGHFTQVIWASSRHFGVGKARSRSGKIIVVANYQPVGNITGRFHNNVLPPLPENMNLTMSPELPKRMLNDNGELSVSDVSYTESAGSAMNLVH